MAHRITAILCYDAVDYSLAMGRDEARTLEGLKSDSIRESISTVGGPLSCWATVHSWNSRAPLMR